MKQKWIVISIISIIFISFLIFADGAISKAYKKTHRGFLGVIVAPLSQKMKQKLNTDYGVLITEVELDSPADEYGLTEDDVILKVNNVKIRRPNTLTRVIRKIKPGEKAKIVILRDGEKKTLQVKIGELKEKKQPSFSIKAPKLKLKMRLKPALGVHLAELNEELSSYFKVEAGALILEVEDGSPAEKAGLKAGDVIVRIEEEKIDDPKDVREVIDEFEPGEEIAIEIVRHGKNQQLTAKLEKFEDDENIFIVPGDGKHNFMMFDPERLMEMNERLLRWYSPHKNIRIEKKKIIRTPDNII